MHLFDFMTTWPLWQLWLAVGIILMIAEMVLPGFFIFFFGVAAFLMSLLTFVALCFKLDVPFFAQAILFTLLSFIGVFFFRNALRASFTGKKIGRDNVMTSDFIGKPARVIERVTPHAEGKVEFNGSNWRAVSDATLEAGETVTITAQENLTLTVAPK